MITCNRRYDGHAAWANSKGKNEVIKRLKLIMKRWKLLKFQRILRIQRVELLNEMIMVNPMAFFTRMLRI
jgi:hypothetical protein